MVDPIVRRFQQALAERDKPAEDRAAMIARLVMPPILANAPASIMPGHITYVSSSFWPLFEVHPSQVKPVVVDGVK